MNITIIFYVVDSLGMNSMRFDQSGCYCLHVRNFKTVTKFDGWRWQVAKADFAALVELLRGATAGTERSCKTESDDWGYA